MSRLTKVYIGLVAFSLAGSLFSRITGLDPGPIAPASAVLVLLLGVAAAFAEPLHERRARLALLLVLCLGAAAEVAGLYTGIPFGRYVYSDRWWPIVSLPGGLYFPLLLPLAWLLVAGCSYLACSRWVKGWAAVPVTALIAALVDLVMEPVMTGVLGYWRWLDPGPLPGGAPLLNFAGWFLVSALAGLILRAFGVTSQNGNAQVVLVGHVALTLGLGLIHQITK